MLTIHAFLKSKPVADDKIIDVIILDYDQRYCRRSRLHTSNGTDILIDFKHACLLEDSDYLVTHENSYIKVIAANEKVLDIYPGQETNLAKIAWHIGNRHCPTQIFSHHLRIRYDYVLEKMLQGLGAETKELIAPFSPEQGAYAHEHQHA